MTLFRFPPRRASWFFRWAGQRQQGSPPRPARPGQIRRQPERRPHDGQCQEGRRRPRDDGRNQHRRRCQAVAVQEGAGGRTPDARLAPTPLLRQCQGAASICYDPNNLNVRVGPDFYFASGVDAPAIERTKLYLPWEAGKPPDFVLEIASESTAEHDVTGKRQIYAEIGVPEYWRFDRSGGGGLLR